MVGLCRLVSVILADKSSSHGFIISTSLSLHCLVLVLSSYADICYLSVCYLVFSKATWYLVDCCTPATDVVGRRHLQSATEQLLVVLQHRFSTVGCRAFAVHGPMVWNSLPDDLCTQQDFGSFKLGLAVFWVLAYLVH